MELQPINRLLTGLLVALASVAPAQAQDAFSTISFGGGATRNVNESEFHRHWLPGEGYDAAVTTPFYIGEAQLGGAVHRYESITFRVPRFEAILVYLGWGIDVSPFDRFSWHNGFRIGNYRMTFDEETFTGVRNESELILGGYTRLDVHLTNWLTAYGGAQFMRVYTAPRFDIGYVSGGLTVTLRSPGWLRTFLE